MYRNRFLCTICFLLSITSFNTFAKPAYAIITEIFAIPGERELEIKIPKIWNYQLKRVDEYTPPLLTFYVIDEERNEIFQLNVSMLWTDGYAINIATDEAVKKLVLDSSVDILPYSDEENVELISLQAEHAKGYYYELTDSNSAPHEFKYLLQGAAKVGDIVLIFSLFANETDSILQEATINIIKSAKIILHNKI